MCCRLGPSALFFRSLTSIRPDLSFFSHFVLTHLSSSVSLCIKSSAAFFNSFHFLNTHFSAQFRLCRFSTSLAQDLSIGQLACWLVRSLGTELPPSSDSCPNHVCVLSFDRYRLKGRPPRFIWQGRVGRNVHPERPSGSFCEHQAASFAIAGWPASSLSRFAVVQSPVV